MPKTEERILVLAPSAQDSRLTSNFLQEAGIPVLICANLSELVSAIDEGCAAVLLAEESLVEEGEKSLVKLLPNQPSWSDLPIILVTSAVESSRSSCLDRLSNFRPAVNLTFLERPFRPLTLINLIQAALRSRRRQYQVRDLLAQLTISRDDLEKRVAQRTSQLSEANEQLEALVYSIAHDLRAPLRAMQAYSTILLDEYAPRLDSQAKFYAERITRSSESMDKLIIDLLAYGRVARAELSLSPVAVQAAWQNAVTQCENDIEKNDVEIKTDMPLPQVKAHEATLIQVLANLLSNAIKFVPRGTQPCIRFASEEEKNCVRLKVQDNGIGIASDHHERIFRVFERLQGNAYAGTGIGLSIVRKGVERMGGRVGVESAPGKGSIFWLELPKA